MSFPLNAAMRFSQLMSQNNPDYEYFVEQSGPESIANLLEEDHAWMSYEDGVKGFIFAPYWVKFDFENDTDARQTILIEEQWALVNHLHVYLVRDGKVIFHKTDGDRYPIAERDRLHRYPVFELKLDPGTYQILFRYESDDYPGIRLKVWTVEGFYKEVQFTNNLLGAIFGCLMVMALYNFFIYLVFKEKPYLYYTLYVLSFLIFQIFHTGIAFRDIWDHKFFVDDATIYLSMLTIFFVVFFTETLLNLPKKIPAAILFGRGIQVMSIMTILVQYIDYQFACYLALVVNLFLVTWLLSSSIPLAIKRDPIAQIFIAAWLIFIIGNTCTVFYFVDLFPSPFIGRWGMLIGSTIEAVLLSFGLAYNFYLIRKQAHRAQINETRLMTSMETARVIQEALIHDGKNIDELEIETIYIPAETTAGDWVFVKKTSLHRIYFIIGDVTGHGIGSAMMTGAVNGAAITAIHFVEEEKLSVQQALKVIASRINEVIFYATEKSQRLMTANFFCFDYSQQKLYFLNAGHHGAYLRKAAGFMNILFHRGSILGVSLTPEFNVDEIGFFRGDFLFCFTDGLIENPGKNRQPISIKQIEKTICVASDLQNLVCTMRRLSQENWQEQVIDDDISVLMIGNRLGQKESPDLDKLESNKKTA